MTAGEEGGIEYDLEFIRSNPIETQCRKCHRQEPINAPSLANVRCFWCGSELSALHPAAYRERLESLWKHSVAKQSTMNFEVSA